MPEKLILKGAEEAALWIGEGARWERAAHRYRGLTTRWPAISRVLPRYFEVLADGSDTDHEKLSQMLTWLSEHPESNLYPRQLPIAGVDSKWLERNKGVVGDLLAAIQGDEERNLNFYRRCGLKTPPLLIRMRVLDPQLRRQVGGVSDLTAPIEDLAALDLAAAHVFIVENLQTGLAFSDLPGSVVFMRLGYHVDVLARLPWLSRAKCIYWGDIDTHGFAILARARTHLAQVESVLMDEATLLRYERLWGEESEQHAAREIEFLTECEQFVYSGLKQQRWGQNVRLEQERIAWDVAWECMRSSISAVQS